MMCHSDQRPQAIKWLAADDQLPPESLAKSIKVDQDFSSKTHTLAIKQRQKSQSVCLISKTI